MKRFLGFVSAVAIALVGVTGGCSSSRGPSNAGGGGRPATGAPNIQLRLPTPQRDPLGYDLAAAPLNGVAGGEVGALAPVPGSAAATLAGHAPLNQVAAVVSLTAVTEGGFPFAVADLASVGTLAFAATGDPAVAGAGDVWRRVELAAGRPTWSLVLDTGASQAALGVLGSGELLVAVGGPGQPASLLLLDPATSAIVDSRALGASFSPRTVVEFPAGSGAVWVGGAGAVGAPAVLIQVSAGQAIPVTLPSPGPAAGGRQELAALIRAPADGGGELLALAVADYDAAGAPLQGAFLISDGSAFSGVGGLSGDAPTRLAYLDGLQAGTALGRLVFQDAAGAFQDEPGFPAVERVTSLLARDRKTLLVGCRSLGGARLVVRTGKSP